ncbi:Apl3 protein [Starmerella bacillaris]|uniref:AP-2 complex subunit alpha n=1 Tax=Starmerella bacillaris TaxID=1247836 RepID=A0AAV5RNM7_STABA|nr:Apl3 protein [Starmerella bacillaris]
MQIRGLSQFIADVRAASTAEAERTRIVSELQHIRRKISSGKTAKSKSSYECRKVVAKLLFIYILGYDIDFGLEEMISLVKMPGFSEKHIGYLAISLLYRGNEKVQHDIMPVVVADLHSPHEYLTALALNYASQHDNISTLSQDYLDLVYQLMVSPTSSPSVAKKATLCMASYFRKDPQRFIEHVDFADRVERVCAVFVGSSLGIATALVALIREIAYHSPETLKPVFYRQTLQKLGEVFYEKDERSSEYAYYGVPAPWLVTKLCGLLCSLRMDVSSVSQSDSDEKMASKLCEDILVFCLRDIENVEYNSSADSPLQHMHARTMVLIAACKLAQQLSLFEQHKELNEEVLDYVKQQLDSTGTTNPTGSRAPSNYNATSQSPNQRYFALELLKYVPVMDDMEVPAILLGFLKDRDVSVRALILDVLYACTTPQNVEYICSELLDVLAAADLQTRPPMIAQLAAMIEKFTFNAEWFFDTCLTLLVIGGNSVEDSLWQRLVQTVVDNETIQNYAIEKIYDTLKTSKNAKNSRAFVCAAGYILGEFAYMFRGDILDLIAALQDTVDSTNAPALNYSGTTGSSGQTSGAGASYTALVAGSGAQSTGVLLTTYFKIAAWFPDVRPDVADILEVYASSMDQDTQQRAIEYIRMLAPENQDMLNCMTVRRPVAGNTVQNTNVTGQLMSPASTGALGTSGTPSNAVAANITGSTGLATLPLHVGRATLPRNFSQSSLSATSTGASTAPAGPFGTPTSQNPRSPVVSSSPTSPMHLSSNWEFGFKRMLTEKSAVLYQDALLQIGCIVSFHKNEGTLTLHLKNISAYHLTSIAVTITNPVSDQILQVRQVSSIGTSLSEGQSTSQTIKVVALQPFAVTPTCRISYFAGVMCECTFKLPIVLEKFLTPTPISSDQFSQRWAQLGSDLEFSKKFLNISVSRAQKSVLDDEELITGMGYSVVRDAVAAPALCAAGILHTSVGGMFGCLLLLEPDATGKNYTVTVRSTQNRLVSVILVNNVARAYNL